MKIKAIFIALLIFFLFQIEESYGQISKVEYYTFTKNTIDTTSIRSYLLFDNYKSLFVWKSLYQERKSSKKVSDDDSSQITFKKVYKDTIGTRVFNNYSNDKLILREPLLDENFTVIDNKLEIKWKFSNEFKDISGFNCQKATAFFRGRYYIAWFTTKIPVPSGPWKLNGLPGLILEAYDKDREVNFLFKKLYKCNNCCEKVEILINDKTIAIKNFVKEKDNMYQKILTQALSKLPRGVKVENLKTYERNGIELKYEWED
tara:strand:- start:158 stop:937 length:780 start_codon:yes stop_codon:yes gene_type:complete